MQLIYMNPIVIYGRRCNSYYSVSSRTSRGVCCFLGGVRLRFRRRVPWGFFRQRISGGVLRWRIFGGRSGAVLSVEYNFLLRNQRGFFYSPGDTFWAFKKLAEGRPKNEKNWAEVLGRSSERTSSAKNGTIFSFFSFFSGGSAERTKNQNKGKAGRRTKK